ncbi:hypothetical protein FISHEDRAFT_75776 [Fistulina hepatica ATCC 64428]|uniref:DRBM domain-containing protein n=1 Tax=Fistulina hepatica ATCC 64428 TaxID=1128425 RepID=A0A0D7A6B4_9AGAR|nr:hypothetical protein FISHEDRAFT_75776 [Fistulina hepatica ATCC 64428]
MAGQLKRGRLPLRSTKLGLQAAFRQDGVSLSPVSVTRQIRPSFHSGERPSTSAHLQAKNQLSALTYLEWPTGPGNNPTWTSQAKINGEVRGEATGDRKMVAREAASRICLQWLQTHWGP